MIPISLPSDHIAFVLRPNASLESAQALFLAQPTPVSELIINLKGRKQDLEGNFGLLVAYFNHAGNSLLFNFSARVHDKNEIEIVQQIYRPDFLCTSIKFLSGSHVDSEPLIFNIDVYKFEDEFEKMHFIDSRSDN